jgi:hypothetical protein
MDSRPISSPSSAPVSSGEIAPKEQTPPHQRITAETRDKAPMSEQQLASNARDRETSPHRLHPSRTVASRSTLQSHQQRHSVDNVPVTEAGLQEVFDAATTNFGRRLDQRFQHANDQFAARLKEVGTKLSNEIETRTQTASAQIQRITDIVEGNIKTLESNIETLKKTHDVLETGHKKRSEIFNRTQARQEARRAKREAEKSDPKS